MEAQPYRRSGSRAPSVVLDTMRAGRSAAGHEQMARAVQGKHGKPAGRVLQVPRVTPLHKRVR